MFTMLAKRQSILPMEATANIDGYAQVAIKKLSYGARGRRGKETRRHCGQREQCRENRARSSGDSSFLWKHNV